MAYNKKQGVTLVVSKFWTGKKGKKFDEDFKKWNKT